ncbi:MAG TPA: carbohydrate kinase [Verrucomicrobiae bacterium]|nr:carbohydrate kinase [Verrucomicrobiae bacterium]
MTEPRDRAVALCFGEMLWDSLPRGLFPGGAPMNVAYHLHQLGLRAAPVSAVGRDALGDELLQRVTAWGLDTDLIRVRDDKPTGLVRVRTEKGGPAYDIMENVAWDWIKLPARPPKLVGQARALIFGTLAQRAEPNRKQFSRLRERCGKALKVFDVNLRPPYDAPDLVWSLAKTADVIKLNHDEAKQLLGKKYSVIQLESAARDLSAKTNCPRICITAGKDGSGLLIDSHWTWLPSRPIAVKDTVGAGDAFLAALVHGLLVGKQSARDILTRARNLAEFVASHDGATPAYKVAPDGEIKAS